MRVLSLLLLVVLLTGCVATIPKDQQIPVPGYTVAMPLLVSVIDQRQRVLDGKDPTFIGVAHGPFGIPADWHVKPVLAVEDEDKDRTLAQFLENRISAGLVDKGWLIQETQQTALPNDTEADALMQSSSTQTLLVLLLKEWYFSINLSWVTAFNFDTDVDVLVYKQGLGNILRKNFKERDVIDEEASDSPRNKILGAYRDQLVQILNDSEVEAALQSRP